jgi:hypothetical protein
MAGRIVIKAQSLPVVNFFIVRVYSEAFSVQTEKTPNGAFLLWLFNRVLYFAH